MLPTERLPLFVILFTLIGSNFGTQAIAQEDSYTVKRTITQSQTTVSKDPSPSAGSSSSSSSSSYTKGVGFKNSNKVEFKYKERLENFKEQRQMGIDKGWLTSQEALEFKEKIDSLEALEKKVEGKGYPKAELDNMEKMFTRYNQQFHKASTTPMDKKSKTKQSSKNSIPTTKKPQPAKKTK